MSMNPEKIVCSSGTPSKGNLSSPESSSDSDISENEIKKEFCDIKIKAPEQEPIIPISKWPEIKSDNFIENILINKPRSCPIANTERLYKDGDRYYYRNLRESHFYRVKPNGGKENG